MRLLGQGRQSVYNLNALFGLNYAVPLMRDKGMTQKQIDTIMIENPRRIFTFV
jgi:predicted metal-dependent phosphotriesterase family hydrolase